MSPSLNIPVQRSWKWSHIVSKCDPAPPRGKARGGGHGSFKASVSSEACSEPGVSSGTKRDGWGVTQSSTKLINQLSKASYILHPSFSVVEEKGHTHGQSKSQRHELDPDQTWSPGTLDFWVVQKIITLSNIVHVWINGECMSLIVITSHFDWFKFFNPLHQALASPI